MKNAARLILLGPMLIALTLLGCATPGEHDAKKARVDMPAPVLEKPEYIFHKVMAGETLATIAQWYSGKSGKWREIAKENPELSPFNLQKDQIVKVPVSIATVHKEQPAFSTLPRKKAKKAAPKASDSAGQSVEELSDEGVSGGGKVFGPK